jgi:hypothetical protein
VLISGWQQALTVLAVIVPGFVYQGVRSRLRGPAPGDLDLGLRLIRSLAASGLFALIYIAALGTWVIDQARTPAGALDNPRKTAFVLLALVFIVPAGGAALLHFREVRTWYPGLSFRQKFQTYNPTPTAWDFATANSAPGFVRVLTKESLWVGGYAGTDSFYSTYPEMREIFLEQAWELDAEGAFIRLVEGTSGVWIKCDDAHVVQFLIDTEQQGEET